MAQSFAEYASPADTISAILGTYPFSIGLFRELIQNSDDAKASKQVFVLDSRHHPTSHIFHSNLASTQGPALLAYNDALFTQDDWDALQSIHRSSKKTDTSKIGKYGIGFRSSYHVTDTPQILSNGALAILDPLHIFSDSGGTKLDLVSYPDHQAAFDFFPANGSVIRLPLRSAGSAISKQTVSGDDIRTLFRDFIREELSAVLLFLKHVQDIEIWEVDATGKRFWLAGASASRQVTSEPHNLVTVNIDGVASQRWRVLRAVSPREDAVASLTRRLSRDVRPILDKHKLYPDLSIAIPLDNPTESGRLFTYLPLPIHTGFKFHIHAPFALTQSRQNLVNKAEVGIVQGSDDSLLVEWNSLLFEEYIPRAWVSMLSLLIEIDNFTASQIYAIWPLLQGAVETGDALYWKDIPTRVLACAVTSDSIVWPTNPHSSRPESSIFQPLSAVHIASADIEPVALQVMADTGLSIAQPPDYIQKLLDQTAPWYTALTPNTAHRALLERTSVLASMSAGNCLALLEFLVSTKDLELVADLPIVPLVNRKLATLSRASLLQTSPHVLLDDAALPVWENFNGGNNIPLKSFSEETRQLFVEKGPLVLGLGLLEPETVVTYLKASPFNLDFCKDRKMERMNEVIVLWLVRFWKWVGDTQESQREVLMSKISTFFLLPTRTTALATPDDGVFLDGGLSIGLVGRLQALGINFLHPQFHLSAKEVVVKRFPEAVRSPSSGIHTVLDRINVPADFAIDDENARSLLNFVVQAVLNYCREKPLSSGQQNTLRALPIFPILIPGANIISPIKQRSVSSRLLSRFEGPKPKTNTTRGRSSIPAEHKVYAVHTTELLPIASDVTFLDGSCIDVAILAHLNPAQTVALNEVDIVALALEYFPEQSAFLKTAFMEYMVIHRESVPPRLINILLKVEFLRTMDGSVRALEHVVDPLSALPQLFPDAGDRVPRQDGQAEMLKQLRILGVLRGALTPEIVLERVQHISGMAKAGKDGAKELSVRLFDLLFTSGFDATQLEVPVDAQWVPTNRGMLGHEACLDRGMHRPELFDQVLPVVDEAVTVSVSLRLALGWDRPLPLATLAQQLDAVVKMQGREVQYRRLRTLIKEFGSRDLQEQDVATLRGIVGDAAWIPVSSHRVVTTGHAVFSLPLNLDLPGFHEIPAALLEREGTREFLRTMGCQDRPSTSTLLVELRRLAPLPTSNEKLASALKLLRALPPTLTEEEREMILVPDIYCNMRPSKEVFFNDIGDRAYLEAGELVLAHPRLDDHIAKRLHLSRLGLKFLHLRDAGLDMGEKLTTTIRNTLKQYTEQQTLTEFLANASDAGATKFKVLIDDMHGPTEKLLSPAMVPFQRCSSLVIYNNSVFTQADFEGICKTGVGGKEGKTNTIGQFGLGALSMFHFTELGMIVSGDRVLFLNPCKAHLPLEDRASLLMPLQQMRRLYPDHLAPLDGLFGFDIRKSDSFEGTIFRLPLRIESHISESSILNTVRTSDYVRDQIVRTYWRNAQQSLLFSKIDSIATHYRTASGRVVRGWALYVDRQPIVEEGVHSRYKLQLTGYTSPEVEPVIAKWQVATTAVPISDLPKELLLLREPHRLRSPIIAGFAARLTTDDWKHPHNLFSTLPLPMSTTLPMHMSASFILTPDRRHIRFDDYDNLESKYNRWLLTTVAPPLYLYMLATIHREIGYNENWWPGNVLQQDSVTRALVDAIYEDTMPTSKMPICTSYFKESAQLAASEAVILGDEPKIIWDVLKMLRLSRYIVLSPIIQQRCRKSMQVFSPQVLQADLLLHAFRFIALYEQGVITLSHVEAVIQFLSTPGPGHEAADLHFLPLVPLTNGTLACIQPADYKTKYYVWRPTANTRQLFQAKDLIHSDFDATLLLNRGFNVFRLEMQEVAALIRPVVPISPKLDTTDTSVEGWINNFWKEYNSFNMDPHINAREFPLLPTTRKGHYVSLKACYDEPSVLVVSSDLNETVLQGLDILGMSIVNRNDSRLPGSVCLVLSGFPLFKVDKLLAYLETQEKQLLAKFALLESVPGLYDGFAAWLREQVGWVTEQYIPLAKKLPIWAASSDTSSRRFHAATQVSMLPYNFPGDLVGTSFNSKPCVEFAQALRHLSIAPLSVDDFYGQLKMKPGLVLTEEDSRSYRRALSALLSDTGFTKKTILLPNGNRVLVKSDTLYERNPLFLSAFGADSMEHFVHLDYIDMEARFNAVGMKTKGMLDLETFIICARSIQGVDAADDRARRAQAVYLAYCEDLPLRMTIDDAGWKRVDKIRFIPREPTRQRAMRIQEYSDYTKALPSVVAPGEVLLPQYESVAWTQRALLTAPPPDRVLVGNPSFGKPTIPEVIEHLRVLVLMVARDHIGNSTVLFDLERTYKYLDEHQDEIGDALWRYHDQKLFLNVHDPHIDAWVWNSADDLFFNIVDNGELVSVRTFLEPFKDLLYVAGVEEIKYPEAPKPALTPVETQYAKLKEEMNIMRESGVLTDVVLVCEDEVQYLAHRAFLATMSEYLKDLFCGDFTEAGPASAADPVRVNVDYSGECVGVVIDFIYTGKPPSFENVGLGTLLDIMDLSAYWGFTELNELTQAKIIAGGFINPSTYGDILQRATVLDATFLLEACEFYERENMDAIERMRGGERKPRKNARVIPKKGKSTMLDPMANTASADRSRKRMRRPSEVMNRMMHRFSTTFTRAHGRNASTSALTAS
ncbi:hypothetical protein CYLTODRAFT_458738 [Cylindrobasidium torrendii FP15055 ss-10]|uniref:BTB domain-containing protein n=1 Tax=Cylindrobasidium torrendii FP15055 ss-10 TaxID=1314674 RepID=A0A0D7AWJ3_9AGAR|nr:hypothetical protein CYLTODRAFT_458738 [Cylindrobasidium torrendii FP15055 ss-10]